VPQLIEAIQGPGGEPRGQSYLNKEVAIRNATASIEAILDDWCGTPPRRFGCRNVSEFDAAAWRAHATAATGLEGPRRRPTPTAGRWPSLSAPAMRWCGCRPGWTHGSCGTSWWSPKKARSWREGAVPERPEGGRTHVQGWGTHIDLRPGSLITLACAQFPRLCTSYPLFSCICPAIEMRTEPARDTCNPAAR
jgi:hypothetical protein